MGGRARGQRRQVVAALQAGNQPAAGVARAPVAPVARSARRSPRSPAAGAASGSRRWASKPAETRTSCGRKSCRRGSSRPSQIWRNSSRTGIRRQRRVDDVAHAAFVGRARCRDTAATGGWTRTAPAARGRRCPACRCRGGRRSRRWPRALSRCWRSACAAATATLLNRQKPIGLSPVAWWPGGRTAQKRARRRRPCTASTAATTAPAARSAGFGRAGRQSRCRRPAAGRPVAGRAAEHACDVRGGVHAQQLLDGWRGGASTRSSAAKRSWSSALQHGPAAAPGDSGWPVAGFVLQAAGWV